MSDAPAFPYEERDGAIVWHKEGTALKLTNWTARIVADRIEDDGEEQLSRGRRRARSRLRSSRG